MIRNLLIVATALSISACTISNDPNWGKPKKPEVRYPAYIPQDGGYACVYDIVPDAGQPMLTNNVRVKKPPTAILAVKKVNDGKVAARLELDTGAIYEGYNLDRMKPGKGYTSYRQSPTPNDMGNSYYFLEVAYATDENMNVTGVSAYYQDVSVPASIIARCVDPSQFKEMIKKPHFGWW